METNQFRSLKVSSEDNGRRIVVELDHGRANEMGSVEIGDWELLARSLETDAARTLVTYSARRTAKGTPVFIAGANVTERAPWTSEEVRAHVQRQRAALAALRRAPVFHVAVVDGVALGWGTEFLLTCDYRIAAPTAQFGLPETGLGIVPGAGGTAELWSVVGLNQALRLGMTGETIDAQEALRIGLVEEACASLEAGLARARGLADRVARRSPTAVAAFKRGALAAVGAAARASIEAAAYEICVESGEAARGRAAFKEILAGGEAEWGPKRLLP